MKTSVKEQWIDRLRSGQYRQGKNSLKTEDNRFCCLGVLIESIPDAKIVEAGNRAVYKGFDMQTEGQINGYIPTNLAKEIGLDVDVQHMLVNMNDNDGYTFKDIAKYIEDNL